MEVNALYRHVDRTLQEGDPRRIKRVLGKVRDELEAMRAAERGPEDKINSREFVTRHFREVLGEAGITSGRIAELGGANNSFRERFPEFAFEFLSLNEEDDPSVHYADITRCPHIPDASYDAVFSISVMEHVARPWAAAREIRRILKPGGVVYHAAPFSYFFHGAPMDFWRYTPDAMKQLFPDFECLYADFYGQNRRRNNLGSKANPIDRDGGPRFAPDAFGGWRENWFTLYAARKTPEAAAAYALRQRQQLAVDLVAVLKQRGVPQVLRTASLAMTLIEVDVEGDLAMRSTPRGDPMPREELRQLWYHHRDLGFQRSSNRPVIAHLLDEDARGARRLAGLLADPAPTRRRRAAALRRLRRVPRKVRRMAGR